MKFVVVSGLTRRLVEADDARAARVIFLRDVPRGNLLMVPYEACKVYEASASDVEDFRTKRHKAKFDDQTELDLGDRLGDSNHRPRSRGQKKEHA